MDIQPVSRSIVYARKYEATKSKLEALFSEKDLKEVKIPMSDFPKKVQEKLQQRLNHN